MIEAHNKLYKSIVNNVYDYFIHWDHQTTDEKYMALKWFTIWIDEESVNTTPDKDYIEIYNKVAVENPSIKLKDLNEIFLDFRLDIWITYIVS